MEYWQTTSAPTDGKPQLLEQVCDEDRGRSDREAKLAEQALLTLESDRSRAETLHIQLEAEIERLHAALIKAETEARRPWWHRLRNGRLAAVSAVVSRCSASDARAGDVGEAA
nr:hypothetical protein [uncultured Rhodopila sp.]